MDGFGIKLLRTLTVAVLAVGLVACDSAERVGTGAGATATADGEVGRETLDREPWEHLTLGLNVSDRDPRQDADAHIEAGQHVLLTYGLGAAFGERDLDGEVRLTFKPVAGCVVWQELMGYVGAYNARMLEAIEDRFGRERAEQVAAKVPRAR